MIDRLSNAFDVKVLLIVFLYFVGHVLTAQWGGKWSRYEGVETGKSTDRDVFGPYIVDFLEVGKYDKSCGARCEILRKLDANTWVVRWSDGSIKEGVNYRLKPANNLWKLSDHIFDLDSFKKNDFLVNFISTDITVLENYFKLLDKTVLKAGLILIHCTPKDLYELVDFEAVRFISDEAIRPKLESRVLDLNLNPNRISTVHQRFSELSGSGITISIQEDFFNTTDLDLIGRYKPSDLNSDIVSLHATEMATIIAGAGNSFVTGRGVAHGATLTSSDFSTTFPDDSSDYQGLEAFIQNHSYGTAIEAFYGIAAQRFDESAFELPSLLHVFSSGNSGLESGAEGTYVQIEAFANLTGNFKMAKNVMVVGSVDTIGRAIDFASRGPAYDGRIRPDISAYSMVGSSNSAALVSGTAALLQQAYLAKWGEYPSSSLLKALLVTGADDLDEPGPDFVRGHGSLNALNSIQILRNDQFFEGSITSGVVKNHLIAIPESAATLKVGLTWLDPPANPGDAIALINDLDLKLINERGEIILPWVLNASPDASALSEPAIRAEDHLNNVELVSMNHPKSGTYRIEISNDALFTANQSYAVAYLMDTMDVFTWDYPVEGANFPYNGETDMYFRWKSTLTAERGVLEYRTLENSDWQTIQEGVDLEKGYLRWTDFPENLYAAATARMIVGNDTFPTQAFTLSPEMDASVGFNCGDSLLMQWPKIDGVVGYDIYQLGDQYLELVQSTEDTSIILSEDQLRSKYFSIQPMCADGLAYLPTYTFDYTRQGTGCFLSSFYQEVVLGEGIYLNVFLSTVYGIDSMDVEAFRAGAFELVGRVVAPEETRIRLLDDVPSQGYNQHRVRIYFTNGEVIQQEADGSYYLTERPSLVFPNPVLKSQQLSVYTKEFDSQEARFRLFDAKGVMVLEQMLLSMQESIELTNVGIGVYFYVIEADHESYRGKIIIE